MPQKSKYILPDIDPNNNIGKNIIEYRKSKGYPQKELAAKIGLSAALLSHYETGKLNVPIEVLAQISITLNTDINLLIGIKKIENKNKNFSPRMIKRMNLIEKLPLLDKKALLKTIDNTLKGSGLFIE